MVSNYFCHCHAVTQQQYCCYTLVSCGVLSLFVFYHYNSIVVRVIVVVVVQFERHLSSQLHALSGPLPCGGWAGTHNLEHYWIPHHLHQLAAEVCWPNQTSARCLSQDIVHIPGVIIIMKM